MDKLDILNESIDIIEKHHPNLYHNITKEEFYKHKKKLADKANSLSQLKFDYKMKKLFALIGDAHTNYRFSHKNKDYLLNAKFVEINNKYYVKDWTTDDKMYYEVTKINNLDIDYIVDKIAETISYETESFKKYKIQDLLSDLYQLKMIEASKESDVSITCEILKNDKKELIEVGLFKNQQNKNYGNKNINLNYSFDIVNKNVLYIKYTRCREDERYPFMQMIKEIDIAKKKHSSTQFIVDLRNNLGGNSNVIKPLINYLKQNNMTGVTLIDKAVFSSGIFAVADLKRDLNAKIIGEPTGGPVETRYGNVRHKEVGNRSIGYSTKTFNFQSLFNYVGSVRPDILVYNTLDDYNNGTDTQLETAIETLQQENNNECQL